MHMFLPSAQSLNIIGNNPDFPGLVSLWIEEPDFKIGSVGFQGVASTLFIVSPEAASFDVIGFGGAGESHH